MKSVTPLLFAPVLLAFAAMAQTGSGGGSVGAVVTASGGFVSNTPWFTANGPTIGGHAVTGMPYSAEEITEHVQTLADGTHITQTSARTKFYRDSEGRTRIERSFMLPPGAVGNSGPNVIEISDPASGTHYMLEPRNHTARSMSLPKELPPPPPPPPGAATASGRLGRVFAGSAQSAQFLGPPSAAEAAQHAPEMSHESLGTQTIEGIPADGSRTTIVYPVGAFGNDRPLTTISETWMSHELNRSILTKSSDPRSGETTTRLINISRAEPDPALFQVPADYQIDDAQEARPNR